MNELGYATTYTLSAKTTDRDWTEPPTELGRMLTIPEINRVRRRYSVADRSDGNPWNRSYLTGSLEYRGFSPGGVELAVIRHGDGPNRFDMDRDPGIFRRLLDGAFGEVHVVDMALARRASERRSAMKGLVSLANPLCVARMGGEDEAAALLKQASFEKGHLGLAGCFAAAVRSEPPGDRENASAGVQRIILSWASKLWSDLSRGPGFAALVMTAPELTGEIGRFGPLSAAMTTSAAITDIAPGVSMKDIADDPGRAGWIVDGSPGSGLTRLRDHHGRLMTDELLPGSWDRGWPMHAVVSFEPKGKPKRIVGGVDVARAGDADAYVVLNTDRSCVTVQYGNAVVDRTSRMPSLVELLYDWPVRIAATRVSAQRWWNEKRAASATVRTAAEFEGEAG